MKEEKQPYNDEGLKKVYRSMKVDWDISQESYKRAIDSQIFKDANHFQVSKKRFAYVAAIAAVLISFSFWLRYSKTEEACKRGEQLAVQLPDGSEVMLNSESKITYYHRYWKIRRIVHLEGEAFFDVSKGSPFKVHSTNGVTKVLGTQFNIYCRGDAYNVTCAAGCVSVKVGGSRVIQLNPGQKIKSNSYGFEMMKKIKPQDEMAWKSNEYVFHSINLSEVFEELERRFDVEIVYRNPIPDVYSGRFKGYFITDVLELICKPYGYTFTEIKKNTFLIEVDK